MKGRKIRTVRNITLYCLLVLCILALVGCCEKADVHWGNIKVSKILFLGNSITYHGPNPSIGWNNSFGMAATAQEKDYVHTLVRTINVRTGGHLTAEYAPSADSEDVQNIVNIADIFERHFDTYDNSQLQTQIDYKPDIVVLQFGENMPPVDSEELKAAFKKSLETLLDGLKNSSNPHIFVTGFIIAANPVVDAIKREVCAQDSAHRVFVDLSDYRQDPTNIASSEGLFSHQGVGRHPGDKGMKFIAERVFAAMDAHATATVAKNFN